MKNKLIAAITLVGILSMGASANLATFNAAEGFVNVSEINGTGDGPGAYVFGSGWGVGDLKSVTSDDLTFELFPNINGYDDNPGDAFWRNNAGAGPDGNKWVEASTIRGYALGAGETEATLDFSVGAFDIDSRYSVTAFIKTLDPGAGWATIETDFATITGTSGTQSISVNGLVAGHVLQVGFVVEGINANGATDWGSATATLENVNVVPEPATFGLIGIFGGGLLFLRRRFKR